MTNEDQVYSRVRRIVRSRWIYPLAFTWGFAEALSWPLIAESFLSFVVVTEPARVVPAGFAVTAGSALGTYAHAHLTAHDVRVPKPLTAPRMYETVRAQFAQDGYSALRHQLLSGIPVKVYASEAGRASMTEPTLLAHTAVWRGARIVAVATAIAGVSKMTQPVIRRHYTGLVIGGGVGFGVALSRVYRAWQ